MATLVYRVLIAVLSLLALAGQLAQADAIFFGVFTLTGTAASVHPAYATVVTLDGILTLVMVALALVLAFHPARRRGALPLALTIAVWGYLLAYSGLIILLRPERSSSAAALLFQTHFLMVEMLGLAALLRFSALFPRPLSHGELRDPTLLAPGLGPLQRLRGWLLGPRPPWIAAGVATLVALGVNGLLGNPPSEAALLVLVDVLRFAALSAVILNLRRSYLLSGPAERESARWLGVGFALLVGMVAILMGGAVLTTVTGWDIPVPSWQPMLLDLGLLGFVGGTAMSSFYRGGLRSGPVGRKVVVLTLLALSTLLLAAGLEALFSDVLLGRLAPPRGVGTLVAALTMALAYLRFGAPLGRALEASVRGSAVGSGSGPVAGAS